MIGPSKTTLKFEIFQFRNKAFTFKVVYQKRGKTFKSYFGSEIVLSVPLFKTLLMNAQCNGHL